MSRKDFNPSSNAKMGNNSQANKDVARAAQEVGISKQELSDLLHKDKDYSYSGDYTYKELKELAQEIKDKKK